MPEIDPSRVIRSRPVGFAATRSAAARDAGPAALMFQCRAAGLPDPVLELAFHESRRWRFDLAWPDRRLAVEVEGGTWASDDARGRHTRGAGFERDCEKYAEAAILGWTVLRVTTGMVDDGRALDFIERWWRAEHRL